VLHALAPLFRRRGSLLFSADFTMQSVGGGSVSSYGLSFERASSGYSVRTGTSTVATGGTISSNDVPRFGHVLDADPIALVLEEARTNVITHSNDYSNAFWSVTATRTAGKTDPAGGTNASRIQAASGSFFLGETAASGSSANWSASAWFRSDSGTQSPNANLYRPTAGRVGSSVSFSTAWGRAAISATGVSDFGSYVPVDGRDWSAIGGLVAGAHDVHVYGAQRETAKFTSELINTSGASLTRAGERLYRSTGSSLLTATGALRFYAKLRPKGSSAQYASDMRFWHVDANNHAEVVASTGAVKITIGGTAYTAAVAATWAANDLVEFWLAAGGGSLATVVKYRVNGGSVTTLSTSSPPTQAAITISSTCDLLCNGTSNQFTSRVERIECYPNGSAPVGF
jgi:hypothetical protein